jgi:hypothetical protein
VTLNTFVGNNCPKDAFGASVSFWGSVSGPDSDQKAPDRFRHRFRSIQPSQLLAHVCRASHRSLFREPFL